MDYQYSRELTKKNLLEVWLQLIPFLPARKDFLEIGCFEGRSTVWIIEKMMEGESTLDCVDVWEPVSGSNAAWFRAENLDTKQIEANFDHNVKLAVSQYNPQAKVNKHKGLSNEMLAQLMVDRKRYDFVYVDAAHEAPAALFDTCMAWALLKPRGIMVLDDYLLGNPRDILNRPKMSFDAFCNIYAVEAAILHIGAQIALQKRVNNDILEKWRR